MAMNIFQTRLSDLTSLRSLRVNVPFYDPMDKSNKLNLSLQKKFPLIRMSEIISHISQGDNFRIVDNDEEGNIGFLTIENINDDSINIIPPQSFVPSSKTKVEFLKKGDLITPRVRQIGRVNRINKSNRYIASENILIFHLDADKLKHYKLNELFVCYYLFFLGRHELIQLRTGGGSGNINQWLLQELHIPVIPLSIQIQITKKLKYYEKKILNLKHKILPIQNIIDSVFCEYNLKSTKSKENQICFTTKFHSISNQLYIKSNANYRWFWDINKGYLFNTTLPLIPLSDWIVKHPKKHIKKGTLKKKHHLIELEDIESKTGRIIEKRYVTEIGSNKLLLNQSDIITTALRPYLGYTILNNFEDNSIATPELIPLKINLEKADPKFVKFLLLSYEYLDKIKHLMYGKEHPRIHYLDLMDIKVPNINLTLQTKITSKIEKIEIKNETLRQSINKIKNRQNMWYLIN